VITEAEIGQGLERLEAALSESFGGTDAGR
jgi:hypothetical protein